jgi:hypothetical protein
MMHSLSRRATLISGCAALAIGVAIPVAVSAATPTWTVKAGSAAKGHTVAFSGKSTGASPQIKLTDTTTGTRLDCKSGAAKGSIKVGAGQSGKGLVSISGASSTWKKCTGPAKIVLIPTGSGTWKMTATSYKKGVTTGKLTGIKAKVSTTDGKTCVFTSTGSVPATYTNSTHVLAFSAATSGLKISKVKGCFGLVKNGDKASFSAKYKVTATKHADNPLKITSP